jgi:DNA-binding LacI/PurR family transcriptional regulator
MSYEDPVIDFHDAITMVLRQVDGLIVIPAAGLESQLTAPELKATPIVTLDRPVEIGSTVLWCKTK